MRTLFLIVFLAILSPFSTNASNRMLFPQYKEGHAILRGGAQAMTQFNYNKAEQHMLFIDRDGRSMLLVPDNVITVVIGERVFVPAGDNDAFNERISINDNTFFVRHRVQVRPHTDRRIAFGANVAARDVNPPGVITTHSLSGDAANTTVVIPTPTGTATDVYFRDQSMVFIHNGDRFVEINSLRSLTRQFDRAQRSQIEDFARRYNINFRNVEDVKTITAYALSL